MVSESVTARTASLFSRASGRMGCFTVMAAQSSTGEASTKVCGKMEIGTVKDITKMRKVTCMKDIGRKEHPMDFSKSLRRTTPIK